MARRLAPVLMVQGATSGAGKSLLVTALARWFARRGVRTAPFKAQNMSNHARVAAGGEMGSAQYLQALAAGATPEVRMNPVLLKPEAETRSQVVVLGRHDPALSRTSWNERKPRLWPVVRESLRALREEYELVLAEGAGSPAEVNLRAGDLVNMAVAREAGAAVLLVADIDRGGAFAHLWGTWSLLAAEERALVRGFVLNKFRGDAALLAPAPEQLERWTEVPTLGVLPYLRHRLPDEDAPLLGTAAGGAGPRVAIVAYPYASNLDEFWPLAELARVELVREPAALAEAELVILPGSKHTAASAEWLASSGMARALRDYAASGRPLLGVCGGLQLLGRAVHDPEGVEGAAQGLGLLELETTMDPGKTVRRSRGRFAELEGYWAALSGLEAWGYEIHHGNSRAGGGTREALASGLGFARGNVLGVYLHGLFEDPAVQRALFGRAAAGLEREFDRLADALEEHLDMERIENMTFSHRKPAGRAGPVAPPDPPRIPRLVLYLGGARAGKSAAALARARALGGGAVSFVATASPGDEEMAARAAAHRAERPAAWETIEEPRDAAAALGRAKHDVVVLDCLTLLVSNLLLEGGEAAVREGVEALLAAWRESGRTLVVVSNEVGMGIVPENALARRYRDLLGWANRTVAAAADEVRLVVAGRELPLG
ncbi:cobyric acid synthase CobQ [Oceanithermus profundus DSM 14977]|uniref:Cobyric acid synthase n=1 Tax=Oceanithermus profundus (strain DSM 14977 / NBRC 100410 / VKM B-2274 / 506) TaxID=670487 RepID=E4U6S0_OCEP5|nr:cobyric acid synthase [Oceanithermus profundus]ADR35864.1 cobyric acid synthase CobQ [Oceanithermus profundus DSM 14977]